MFLLFKSKFGEACFLICLPIWILVPNRRGKIFAAIINILLKTYSDSVVYTGTHRLRRNVPMYPRWRKSKEQYISIAECVLTSPRVLWRERPIRSPLPAACYLLSASAVEGTPDSFAATCCLLPTYNRSSAPRNSSLFTLNSSLKKHGITK